MTRAPHPTGLRLNATAPVYDFTRHGDFISTGNAVFLLEHVGNPHWFATDGYSAMLTSALPEDGHDADQLFTAAVATHAYRPEHIKALFRHVKHSSVFHDPATGTLTSPDGIMIVPPFTGEPSEDGELPDPVLPPATFESIFDGDEVEQSVFEFGWKFVGSIRSAFKANSKDASLTMTTLDGSRVRLDVHEPYQGRVLIALNRADDTKKTRDPAAALARGMQEVANRPGIDSVTLSMPGREPVTLTSQTREAATRMLRRTDQELEAEGTTLHLSLGDRHATLGAEGGPDASA
ncbi:hypothetical protein [uncultured Deinococcus sp.]|uniref:hypothetical protein n=1 Tax=uncultured Deinococcus sp. TaxID=158789 RepID=UPI0025D5F42D|nr:hypothetical protein [uncultured Deinococcus sp.]